MDLLAHLCRQFAYNDWANRETLASLKAATPSPPLGLKVMTHVLGAERLWLARLRRETSPLAVWPDLALSDCVGRVGELRQHWRDYFNTLIPDTLSEKVSYTNTKGQPWTNSVGEILTHVVMHSAYHRGQVAVHVRTGGATPAETDFIHCIRQGFIA